MLWYVCELVFRAAVSVGVYRPRCLAHVLLFILLLYIIHRTCCVWANKQSFVNSLHAGNS